MSQFKVIVKRLRKRTAPVTDFTDKSNIIGIVSNGFIFESEDEIANALGNWYADRDKHYYWGGGLSAIRVSHPATPAGSPSLIQTGKASIPIPATLPPYLPVSKSQCLRVANWMNTHFGDRCEAAVDGSPFKKELLYAIACQESAYKWLRWIDHYDADTILARCVFDASGEPEFPDHPRSAPPRNREEFKARFGAELLQMLVDEGNKQRAMPQADTIHGYHPAPYLYKGYGIFQYDLQFILTDDAPFFREKQWYNIDECIRRAMSELKNNWKKYPNDLFNTVKAYNGRGIRAEHYANNVIQFLSWIVQTM